MSKENTKEIFKLIRKQEKLKSRIMELEKVVYQLNENINILHQRGEKRDTMIKGFQPVHNMYGGEGGEED